MLKLKQIGRQHFDPTRPINIPQHKVQLWPGYFTSVAPNQMGIMLIADVAHKVLRTGNFPHIQLHSITNKGYLLCRYGARFHQRSTPH